jgi:hypothetical protein
MFAVTASYRVSFHSRVAGVRGRGILFHCTTEFSAKIIQLALTVGASLAYQPRLRHCSVPGPGISSRSSLDQHFAGVLTNPTVQEGLVSGRKNENYKTNCLSSVESTAVVILVARNRRAERSELRRHGAIGGEVYIPTDVIRNP